jgi:hypothetical protein
MWFSGVLPATALLAAMLIAAPSVAQTIDDPAADRIGEPAEEESFAESEGEEPLETDRDSFTPATTLVDRGLIILETSYSFIDNPAFAEGHSFPELLARVGLSDLFELRLGWNYEVGGGGAVSGSEFGGEEETAVSETETKLLYGFKTRVSNQNGWLPNSALIVHASTPTSGPNTATQFVTGLVAGWELPNGWTLDSGLRYAVANEEGDHFNHWAPSIVLKVPVRESWNLHAEYFSSISQNREDDVTSEYFSPGVHYLVSPNCEVGVRVGWGLSQDAANFFSNVGLGVRF